jgi:DNA-directed RNA polymerase subunit N (RpoN/RPB10)
MDEHILCYTCGFCLGDKRDLYIVKRDKYIEIYSRKHNIETLPSNFATFQLDDFAVGHILDEIGLELMCCRAHMLTMVGPNSLK